LSELMEAKAQERRCPECGSSNVRRSQMRGLWERGVLKPLGVRAFRCAACDQRYRGSKGIEAKDGRLKG